VKKRYEELANIEIQSVKDEFEKAKAEIPELTEEELIEMVGDAESATLRDLQALKEQLIAEQGYSTYEEDEIGPPEFTVSQEVLTLWDEEHRSIFDELLAARDLPDFDDQVPYVISVEEFMTEFVDDYEKITLTWWDGDETLTESASNARQPSMVPVAENLGVNLSYFGVGTNDPEIVHIRNNKKRIDFEVIRTEDAYSKAILGVVDPEHEKVTRPRKVVKMRKEDG
jgi:hypothetical protein